MSGEPTQPKESNQVEKTSTGGGSSMVDLLSLPPAQLRLMNWIIRRRQATLVEVSLQFEQPIEQLQLLLNDLVERGLLVSVEDEGELRYHPYLQRQPRISRQTNLWQKLE